MTLIATVYSVDARQGQRLSVEVEAARLGTLHYGGQNDLAVRIFDASGKELGRNDDSALYVQDPVLSIWLAPATGTYYVEIRQQFSSGYRRPGIERISAASRGLPHSFRPAGKLGRACLRRFWAIPPATAPRRLRFRA